MEPQGASHQAIWQYRYDTAKAVMGKHTEREWWAVILLDEDLKTIEAQRLWVGRRCAIPDYQAIWRNVTSYAITRGAQSLFSLREHPHLWTPTQDMVERFAWMWQAARDAGVPLRQHLHCDITGGKYPCRLHQDEDLSRGTTRSPRRPSMSNPSIALAVWISMVCQLW